MSSRPIPDAQQPTKQAAAVKDEPFRAAPQWQLSLIVVARCTAAPACGPGWKNGSAGGRTKEWHQTGGQNAVRPDTLIPSSQPSTKPGQVQTISISGAALRLTGRRYPNAGSLRKAIAESFNPGQSEPGASRSAPVHSPIGSGVVSAKSRCMGDDRTLLVKKLNEVYKWPRSSARFSYSQKTP